MSQQREAAQVLEQPDSASRRKRIVIVGAGVSGLSAAYAATKADPGAEVIVLEAGAEVGGKAETVRRDGWLIENGPGSFTNSEAPFLEMLREVGHERLPASAAAARRFIYHRGSMREVAAHPIRFLRSGLLSPLGILRIAAEPWVPARNGADGEESLWSFARRRLGPQAADRLIAPMALGVYAGDAKRLSVQAAFPRVVALEQAHGSLIRGAIALRKKKHAEARARKRAENRPDHRAGSGADNQAIQKPVETKTGSATGPGLSSFTDGLQSLPLHLAGLPGIIVRCGVSVRRIVALVEGGPAERSGGSRFRVEDGNGHTWQADAVVVATEPYSAADLLRELDAELSRELGAIPCPPVAVVALGFPPSIAARAPVGFGALVCRGEGVRMLGALWESHIFAARAPKDHLLVRAMFGGSVDPEAARLDDEELVRLARAELEKVTGISGAPVLAQVRRWERAIPQYEVGHLGRVARIEARLQEFPGLYLAGNGLRGISFARAASDGLAQGTAAARFTLAAAARAIIG